MGYPYPQLLFALYAHLSNLLGRERSLTSMAQSLLDTIVIPVTPFHQERLVIIDQEDYSGVEWKARDELEKQGRVVTDEYMDEGILALKQYYAGALLDSRNEHAVSD